MPLCQNPNCHETLPEHARFCRICGTRQVSDETLQVFAPPVEPSPSIENNPQLNSSLKDNKEQAIEHKAPVNIGDATQVEAEKEQEAISEASEQPIEPIGVGGPIGDIARRAWLDEQRMIAATCMLKLIPFVEGPKRNENKELFEKNSDPSAPSLRDASWGNMAFIAGIYARFMWQNALQAEDKQNMWNALVWAVQYERSFRHTMIVDRFKDLLKFFNGCVGDTTFLAYALKDIEILIVDLDVNMLNKIRENAARLNTSPGVSELRQRLDQQIKQAIATLNIKPIRNGAFVPSPPESAGEMEKVAFAIERHWFLLDRKFTTSNQESFNRARQDLQSPQALERLEKLARVIYRNAAYRYTYDYNQPGGSITPEQLVAMQLLSEYSVRHCSEDYRLTATYYALLFRSLQLMRMRSLEPASWASEFKALFEGKELEKVTAATSIWSYVIGFVTHYFVERRRANVVDTVEAESWVQVFASVEVLSPNERKSFVVEIKQHGVRDSIALKRLLMESQIEPTPAPVDKNLRTSLDTVFTPERFAELSQHIRDSRLEHLGEILHEARPRLFLALSGVLSDPSFDLILSPRRPLRMRGRNGNGPDRFPEAKNLIMSANPMEQREGLALFEQAAAEIVFRDFVALAREWRLFALAQANGPWRAVPQWEEDRKKGIASWEEVWNIAVFNVRTNRIEEALEVVKPGVKAASAPFSHLRFALYYSVQILEQQRRFSAETVKDATNFLIDYLLKYPLPECYLAWSLLVNETQGSADFIKHLEVLGIFQEIRERPVTILRPEDNLTDTVVEALEKDLQRLGLEDVWRFWINDYAERNRLNFKAWQALSEACDRAGDTVRAEKALLHIAEMQLDLYQRQLSRNVASTSSLGFLRGHIVRLFDFYRRKALLQDSEVEATFKKYYSAVPQLWDGKDTANTKLINLTRQFLEKVSKQPISTEPLKAWQMLLPELEAVQDVNELKLLLARLNTVIDLLAGNQRLAKDRSTVVKTTMNELCALDATTWRREDLSREVDRLNGAIQKASTLIDQEPVLKPLKALVAAFLRVFKKFSEVQRLAPKLQVNSQPLGPGVASDLTETALVVRIVNPGPGEVTNLRITCTDKGIIASHHDSLVDCLPEQDEVIVAIPVTVRPPANAESVDCQVNLTYQWGIMKDLTSSYLVTSHWFIFHDFLQQHGIHDYDLPNPYVFLTAIDFAVNDPRLFQGRDSELTLVRTVFFKGEMKGAPLYFHGIRKVGKTSLLNRITLELNQGMFAPYVVDLHGIRSSQSFEMIVNTFTERILDEVKKKGLDVHGLQAVPVNHDNPIVGVERFFRNLRACTGDSQLVLLLDEFHVIVASHMTALLDLLRRIHQSDLIIFIMSGWLRPEPMRRLCPETQLFPLMARPIDFLPLDVVRRVLHLPIVDFGIELPEATVQRVFVQTAGNPYHVARIAYNGIARLNAEHRTILTPNDIDEIATQLSNDPANFTSSSFSSLMLTTDEQSVAIRFARELGDQNDFMPVDDATRMFDLDVLQGLNEKYILEYIRDQQGERLRIRSKMLAVYLRNKMAEPITPPPSQIVKKRVGLFIDYENLLPIVPHGMKAQEIGEALNRYAEAYGHIVCRWACMDPRNVRDISSIRLGLEQAHFLVQSPSGEPQTGSSIKNVTDFVLLERINDESTHSEPDIYIIGSGDKDYYEKIMTLLNSGNTVRLCASLSSGHLASKYKDLVVQREQYRIAIGQPQSDFFIDDFDKILQLKSTSTS